MLAVGQCIGDDTPVPEARHWLLSVVGTRFGDPPDAYYGALPFALPYAEELANGLAAFGYRDVERLVDLPSDELGRRVERFLDARGADDVVIVHVISHGTLHERTGRLQVVGADGRGSSHTDVENWVTATEERVHDGSTGPRVLFLVDLCYAGTVARLGWQGNIADEQRRAWVYAATGPGQRALAYSGWFTQAFARTLRRFADGAVDISSTHEHIPVTSIARDVRTEVGRLSRGSYEQRPIFTPCDPTSVPDFPFFPNTHYSRATFQVARSKLDEMARPLLDGVDELLDWKHFVSRATGDDLTFEGEGIRPGVFRGRRRELRRLTNILNGSSARPCHVLVTGSPGAGKSALLGLTVCAAHPVLSEVTDVLWREHRDNLPAVHSSLAVIHCRQRHLSDIAVSICRQLNLGPETPLLDVLVNTIADSRRYPVIVMDALDESNDSAEAVAKFVKDLARVARVVAGTRPRPEFRVLRDLADEQNLLIDLDAAPINELRHSLATYVDDLLRPAYRTEDLLQPRRVIAKTVARMLTDVKAGDQDSWAGTNDHWGGFLVARLFAHQLRDQPVITDRAAAERAAGGVPRSLPAVFELDLERSRDRWRRPVLAALAHSRGVGMPRSIIQAIAGIFGDEEPTSGNVADALDAAGFYLRQDTDRDGTKLYRLFHQGLVDHLRANAAAVPALMALLFTRMTSTLGDPARWGTAEPYLLRHATAHAFAAGALTELLQDAGFLVFGTPASIRSRVTLKPAENRPGRAEFAYLHSYEAHRDLSPQHRRSILFLDAHRLGYPDLARKLSSVVDLPPVTWHLRWATVDESSFTHLRRLVDSARRPAVIGAIPDAPTIAIGTRDHIEVVDVESRTVLYTIPRRDGPNIRCLAMARVEGRTVSCVSSDGWQTEVSVYADGLRQCTIPVGKRTTRGSIEMVAGQAVLIIVTVDNEITGWSLPDGTYVFSVKLEQSPGAMAFGTVAGRASVALELGGRLQVRELSDGADVRRAAGTASSIASVSFGGIDDRTVVASVNRYGVVDVWDAESLRLLRVLLPDAADYKAGTMLPRDHTLTIGRIARDSVVYVGDELGTVMGWNLTTGAQVFRRATPYKEIHAMALATSAQKPVLLVAYAYSVAVLDATDGTELTKFAASAPDALHRVEKNVVQRYHYQLVTGVSMPDTDTMASASEDGTVRVWNLEESPGPLGYRGYGKTVTLGTLGNQRVALTAGHGHAAQVWNLDTRRTICTFEYHNDSLPPAFVGSGGRITHVALALRDTVAVLNLGTVEPDFSLSAACLKDVSCLATNDPRSDRPAVAAGDTRGNIAIWLLNPLDEAVELRLPGDIPVTHIAVSSDNVVVCGFANGTVRAWHATTGEFIQTFHRSKHEIRCLTTGSWSGHPVVAIGCEDGSLLVYDISNGALLAEVVFPAAVGALAMNNTGSIAVGFGRDVGIITIGG